MAHFSVCFKSFNHNHIQRAIRQLQTAISLVAPLPEHSSQIKGGESSVAIFDVAHLLADNPGGVTTLPTTRSRYTVLSGPHIDKKSREQFEIIRKKTRIEFELSQAQAELFYELLKHMYIGGVQVSVRVKTRTYVPSS